MNNYKKGFLAIIGLIVATGSAMAYVASHSVSVSPAIPSAPASNDGLVSVSATLAQTKVLMGSDGQVSMAVDLAAAALPENDDPLKQPVDLVVVLDRSGSMNGQKINDACGAIIKLLAHLTSQDRLALITYSNDVRTVCGLLPVNGANRERIAAMVNQIRSGGGTNLGGGLQRGIDTLLQAGSYGAQRKIILISDGLANQGITDPFQLGQMASTAVKQNFAISTVGVGLDFNEVLMTAIADHGTGRYYFLENPQAFAQVFADECQTARQVAAASLELRIPLKQGVRLVHAGGYPISHQNGYAVIYPGDLRSGQQRRLFLTFAIPSYKERNITFENLQVNYQHQGHGRKLAKALNLTVACVQDEKEVAASVDETTWSAQVLQEDYSRLKSAVADAIRSGKREEAEAQIQAYEARTQKLNADVGSASVTENLQTDLPQLRRSVEETFSGSAASVASKCKQQSKALQYDSYQNRRDKKHR